MSLLQQWLGPKKSVVKLSFTAITILQSSSQADFLILSTSWTWRTFWGREPGRRERILKNFPKENSSPARWRGLAGSTSRKVRSRELASSSTHLCPSSPPVSSWLKNHGIVVFSSGFLIIWFHFSEHLWQTSLCLMWAKSWTMDSDRSSSLFSSTWKKTCSIVRAQACKPGSVCLILTNLARRFENTCETCGSPQGASILRHRQGLRSSLPLHHASLPGKFHALRQQCYG